MKIGLLGIIASFLMGEAGLSKVPNSGWVLNVVHCADGPDRPLLASKKA